MSGFLAGGLLRGGYFSWVVEVLSNSRTIVMKIARMIVNPKMDGIMAALLKNSSAV